MIHNSTVLSFEALTELASAQQSPCLSLYQPTHRRHPENKQDPIRFSNLIKELGSSLGEKYSDSEIRSFLAPFEALVHDHAFWEHAQDGLAVLGGPGVFRVFRLQRPVAELAIAGDSFHTKPLRRLLQSVDRYQVLGLSLQSIRLFEGNRDTLDEIDTAPGVPRTIAEGPAINPDAIPIDELRERAWQVVEPQYQARLASLARVFAVSKSNDLGSDDLAQVALAAAAGRVATLLIESDRLLAGQLDSATGRLQLEDLTHPKSDDLLDDLGELVEKMGGRVFVIPAGQMPVKTGVAATYRY